MAASVAPAATVRLPVMSTGPALTIQLPVTRTLSYVPASTPGVSSDPVHLVVPVLAGAAVDAATNPGFATTRPPMRPHVPTKLDSVRHLDLIDSSLSPSYIRQPHATARAVIRF